ncbi:hypothetical protein B296_00019443 [Ensete ventricosum]|uniref:Uncharacterized protein n=1 Tax=Ensete ventricosum TaxID=4639 RepID=A0A426ZD91_ENSVE|nr:hypothetical protein B296_00019443 [Ensete ventricosum]
MANFRRVVLGFEEMLVDAGGAYRRRQTKSNVGGQPKGTNLWRFTMQCAVCTFVLMETHLTGFAGKNSNAQKRSDNHKETFVLLIQ